MACKMDFVVGSFSNTPAIVARTRERVRLADSLASSRPTSGAAASLVPKALLISL